MTTRSRALEPPSLQPLRVIRDEARPYALCPRCSKRLELTTKGATWTVRTPGDVVDGLVCQLGPLEREELHVLLLDVKNGVVDDVVVYQGNVSTALVRIGELLTEAVRRNASGVILVHTHPSGDPTPSPDDLHLTTQVITAGRLLDIAVLDHLIIAGSGFVSLRELGLPFAGPGDHRARETSACDVGSRGGWVTLTTEGAMAFHTAVPTLAELQAAVGGYVEAVRFALAGCEATLWCNEEGKLVAEPQRNPKAELLCPLAGDWFAGDVAVTGGVGPAGETLELTEGQAAELRRIDHDVHVFLLGPPGCRGSVLG